ncbi:hypothetical protein [Aquimarina longa]|uniref:hypothetical protein n=1 Tax=Aquimarina longa TaxID=1080221 RepID=UPI0007847BE0|nr:hypothetical protein [Aquimarina longa]
MKKTKLLFTILIGTFMVLISCSNDDDDDENLITTQNLISRSEEYYKNNSLIFSLKFNFQYGKLISIRDSDDRYNKILYEGDLISKILEFDTNGNLEWTTTFTYNNSDELIQKKVIPSPNNSMTDVSRQKNFTYEENIIQSESSWSDGGFHKNTISLNNNNYIIEDKMFNLDNELLIQRLFKYVNNNLTNQTIKNSKNKITYEGTYNYLNKQSTKEYRYNEYLFGDNWKNNSSLNKQFGLGQIKPYEISKNYISDYYTHNLISNTSRTGTFSYEFDSNDYITKQTENITWSTGEIYKIITTYRYE